MRSIYIAIPDDAAAKLRELARREFRAPRQQAAVLVLRGPERAGLDSGTVARRGRRASRREARSRTAKVGHDEVRGRPEMSPLLEGALSMAAGGWSVIPLHTPIDSACDCRRPGCSSPGNIDGRRTASAMQLRTPIRSAGGGACGPPRTSARWFRTASSWSTWTWPTSPRFRSDELPGTATSRTGRGRHLIYRTSIPIRPKVGVREHVDLRGPASYIVVPPSLHISGARYVWVVPIEDGIADAPAWIAGQPEHLVRRAIVPRTRTPSPTASGTRRWPRWPARCVDAA